MRRGIAFSAVLHLGIALALILELPLFNKRLDFKQPPAIDIEFADVSDVANLPKAGQYSDEEPEIPVNDLPPPPPPSAKAPPPPPPKTSKPLPPEKESKAPAPPKKRPPAPKKLTRLADKTVPKRTLVREETKVAEALDTLPVPVPADRVTQKDDLKKKPEKPQPPKPKEKVVKKPDVKKPPKVKTAKVTGNSKERVKKRNFLDRMSATVDRLNKDKPRPKTAVSDDQARMDKIVIGKNGASRNTAVGPLTVTETMMVRSRLSRNWTVNKGAPNADQMWVVVKIDLTRSGHLAQSPQVVKSFRAGQSGIVFGAFAKSALKSVQKSAPFPLPPEKFDSWREMVVRFSLADMFS